MGSIVFVLIGCGLLSTTATLFPQNYNAVVSAPLSGHNLVQPEQPQLQEKNKHLHTTRQMTG